MGKPHGGKSLVVGGLEGWHACIEEERDSSSDNENVCTNRISLQRDRKSQPINIVAVQVENRWNIRL
jgi:hypothetical protein